MRVRRLAVEGWAPEYGSPVATEDVDPVESVADVNVELPADDWRPLSPPDGAPPASCVEFVDGVRRIDARVWITDEQGETHLGICASYGAGVVRCDGKARILDVQVRRGLFAPAGVPELRTSVGTYPVRPVADADIEGLIVGLQERMGQLEIEVATTAGSAREPTDGTGPLIVVDGPLRGRQNIPGAIGYIKSHRVQYLAAVTRDVIAQLEPGQRTPVFLTRTTWSRFSWYVRLPGGEGHPWAGIVRCEAWADLELELVTELADATALTLPVFASKAHKDPRAPQNLYPIAALEREMRRRLGDPGFVYRALRVAASRSM